MSLDVDLGVKEDDDLHDQLKELDPERLSEDLPARLTTIAGDGDEAVRDELKDLLLRLRTAKNQPEKRDFLSNTPKIEDFALVLT